MTKKTLLRSACLMLLGGLASAQGVQNSDIAAMFGATNVRSQTIPGTNISMPSSTEFLTSLDYGYQLVRKSAASLWLDIDLPSTSPGTIMTSVPGKIDNSANFYMAGARFMAPIKPRVSIYGVTGVGPAYLHYALVTGGASLTVASTGTVHGAFEFGGGADVRLSRLFSIRIEIRDFVTGTGLSGVEGRNHVAPLLGLVFHH